MKTLAGGFKDLTCEGHGSPVMARRMYCEHSAKAQCDKMRRAGLSRAPKDGPLVVKVEATAKDLQITAIHFENPRKILGSNDEPNFVILTCYGFCANNRRYRCLLSLVNNIALDCVL